ncbi:phosphatase PAP2 family protein [Caenimonas sedimenti]|uniref:Phosphatase PAP2 family protein n=1 Tax=Caenimonas sedimenti TaxID=2596921 RepID=A0A562ZQZ4_9BURK|nr:phosphatase PAP2 family protein [Caenimonas sedimenti]TWO70771.1 phosphatase PAP2 family protein [Caenimonas sedimenti]
MTEGRLAPGHRHRDGVWTLAALTALLAWDASGLDMAVARLASGVDGFALRDHWLLVDVLHDGGRRLGWLVAVVLSVGVWWPLGPLTRLRSGERLRLAGGALAAAFTVTALKRLSPASCPWDLNAFGGVAHFVPHWQWMPDGGSGHCFPAGHAASGFSFVGGWFAFRDLDARVARIWLAGALGTGLVFGLAQQARGAHFLSHTLWTAWICWCVTWAVQVGSRAPAQGGLR